MSGQWAWRRCWKNCARDSEGLRRQTIIIFSKLNAPLMRHVFGLA
jgi:hypothetical protein